MEKLLFIGHSYHQKTHSADFMIDLLAQQYEIEKFYFDPYKEDIKTAFKPLNGKSFDVVVLWQIMPDLYDLSKNIEFNKSVFFPMYDGIPSLNDNRWKPYRYSLIINFCNALHKDLKKLGFHSKYIQFFPKPIDIKNNGNSKSIFFWQRHTSISADTISELLSDTTVNHLHLHKAPDPNHKIITPNKSWKTTYSEWFDTKEEMQKEMQKHAFYFAPRPKEGIGMSFLEAMAMGRCVIAPNNHTMNEYIVHGKTGFLYNPQKLKSLKIDNVKEIQKNTYNYIKNGYENWLKEQTKIFKWIKEPIKIKKLTKSIKILGLPILSIEEK